MRVPDRNGFSGLNPALGKRKIVVLALFGLLLLLGLAVHRDYGVSWDEPFQREYARDVFAYVSQGDQSLFEGPNQYYGPAFELALLLCEKTDELRAGQDLSDVVTPHRPG